MEARNQSLPNINETGQLFVGAQALNMLTRTAHPIHIRTYGDDPTITVPNSISILANSTRDVVINTPLIVNNNLTVSGFYPIKPWVALYVASNAIQTATAVGHVAPSNFTLTHATNGLYSFTFTPAHPNGNNFQIFVTSRTSGTATAFCVCTAKVETDSTAGTKFTVWCRNASNAIIDGDFWVHTVP